MRDAQDDPEKRQLAEELLAVRCQLGEAAAFAELVELLHLRLWRYLVRLIGERAAAEDVLQETWLRVLRDISRLREPGRLVSWIFGIGRHIAIDRLRRRRVWVEASDSEVLQLPAKAEEEPALAARLDQLTAELQELPLLEREVLTLFYLDELSLRQVAEVVGVPEGTIKSRLFRARRLLHERLVAQGDPQ